MISLGSMTEMGFSHSVANVLVHRARWYSLCGIGRSWTETFLGPSKTTAFMVFAVDMAIARNGSYGKR